jgi:hypothetical protein
MERKQIALGLTSRFLRWAGKSLGQAADAIDEASQGELMEWLEKLAAEEHDEPEGDEPDAPAPAQQPMTDEARSMLAGGTNAAVKIEPPTEWTTGAR